MLSSTARLLPSLESHSDAPDVQEVKVVQTETQSETDLEIELTPGLESRLNLLSHRMVILNKPKLTIKKGLAPLKMLNEEFKILTEISKDSSITPQEKLAIEEYKLVIMQAMKKDFQKRYGKKEDEKPVEKPKAPSKWRYALFGAIVLLDLIPMTIGGFLGVSSLMTSIPGVSDILIYGASAAVCAIEGIMYYSVMGPLLKKALNIEVDESAGALLKTYEDKLQVTEQLSNRMINEVDYSDKIKYSHYKEYAALTKQFNDDVSQTKVEKFKESPIKKGLRWGLSTLNLILNVGGGYFMATALLSMVAASLVGTPIGWGIIGLVVIGGLVGRFAIRSNSIFEMLNPKAKKYEETQKKIGEFDNKNEKINSVLLKKKKQVELIEENTKLKTGNAACEYQNRNRTCLPGVSTKSGKIIVQSREAARGEINDLWEESASKPIKRRFSIA